MGMEGEKQVSNHKKHFLLKSVSGTAQKLTFFVQKSVSLAESAVLF